MKKSELHCNWRQMYVSTKTKTVFPPLLLYFAVDRDTSPLDNTPPLKMPIRHETSQYTSKYAPYGQVLSSILPASTWLSSVMRAPLSLLTSPSYIFFLFRAKRAPLLSFAWLFALASSSCAFIFFWMWFSLNVIVDFKRQKRSVCARNTSSSSGYNCSVVVHTPSSGLSYLGVYRRRRWMVLEGQSRTKQSPAFNLTTHQFGVDYGMRDLRG